MLLLPLHATILEPDFDLALGEAEGVSDLNATPTGQVAIEVELFFQLERLVSRVGCPLALRFAVGVHST